MPDAAPNMDFLKKQLGPLPVGGWMVVVGAGLTFTWWRKRSLPTSTNSADTELSPLMTNETIGNIGGMLALLNRGQTGPSTQSYTDNTSWYQQAVRLLIGRGNNPDLVDNALRKYMQGLPLNAAETAIKELALQLLGPIPSPPPPPSTTPTGDSQPRDLSTYKVNPTLTPANIQHLSDYELISKYTITSTDWAGDPGWQDVVKMKYGSDDPLVYLNEIARRYQAGTIPQGALTGPVGSWTSGQPAWNLSWEDINNQLRTIADRQPTRVDWAY